MSPTQAFMIQQTNDLYRIFDIRVHLFRAAIDQLPAALGYLIWALPGLTELNLDTPYEYSLPFVDILARFKYNDEYDPVF